MRLKRAVVRTLVGVTLAALAGLAGCGSPAAHGAPLPVAPSSPVSPSSPASASPTPSTPPEPIQVVGLGDSVTSGEHCDCDDYVTGFGHLLAQQDGGKVTVTNDGESGSTSDDLADELGSDSGLRSDVAQADVVVVTTGANDLAPALQSWEDGSCPASCYDPAVETMGGDLGRVLDAVASLTHGHARVLVTNYWNVFADGDVAKSAEHAGYLAWSDAITRRANDEIAQVVSTHGADLVDTYAPFKADGSKDPTNLLASDGDHPNAAGTKLISEAVLATYDQQQ